jgi:sirohydrochlorin ferrochelatase
VQAVLYIGHGSRIKAGVEEAIWFIERSKAFINVPIQEICFLELVAPNISEGIAKCVARGATKIAIVPILLLTAHHAKKDIPLEIEAGKIQYPDVKFTYGETFGIHSKIIDSLYDRILEQEITIGEHKSVLLVGRGSSDQAVKRDLTKIAQLLSEKYAIKQVDICFLYGSKPSFDEALQELKQTDIKQIFIIPYLLFSGILMNDIESKIIEQSTEDQAFILCENLGYHKNIQKVLIERVHELLEKSSIKQAI